MYRFSHSFFIRFKYVNACPSGMRAFCLFFILFRVRKKSLLKEKKTNLATPRRLILKNKNYFTVILNEAVCIFL